MKFDVFPTPNFAKELKSLSKKYPRIKDDIKNLTIELQENPALGTPLPKNCFKIRMQISGKATGKRGGARIITHVKFIETKIYLLSIYDKADQSNNQILDILLKQI